MTAASNPPRRCARGFTLIEIIIALALMSLIMLGLVSAFATLGKTATRLDGHAGKSGREWLVGEFLRATLSSSIGQIKQQLPDQSEVIHFRGGPMMIQWLGSMPARYGVGGLHLFQLGTEPVASGMALMLRYAPYVKDNPPTLSDIQVQTLAERVTGFRIDYQSHPARADEEAVWSESWEDTENLPARVRIELVSDGLVWPPMVSTVGAIDAAGGKRVLASGQISPSQPQPSP
ncbi:MAG: prepilin-type N-terminal cleavage/methylation domain-containing protein [Azoarcus sp.]|jgi:general secretion pathway protein J|nr:prepilin-type N-terminal cleavage/methylation domain-containing protein [Azoarcus sp.]